MTSWLGDAPDPSLSINDLIGRLSAKPTVAGIVVMGSTGAERFNPGSDHDICLVLNQAAPIRMVATWVQNHLTEVYLTTMAILQEFILAQQPIADSDAAELAGWIREGRIAFDRDGVLAEAQRRLKETQPPKPGRHRAYDWWFSIGYNLAQTKRKLLGAEEHYRLAAEVGIVSCLGDIAKAYFALRGMIWPGDKEAVKYWLANDSEFLDTYLACLREPQIEQKVQLYERVTHLTVGPVGEPWPRDTTMVAFGPVFGSEEWPGRRLATDEALAAWRDLIS